MFDYLFNESASILIENSFFNFIAVWSFFLDDLLLLLELWEVLKHETQ